MAYDPEARETSNNAMIIAGVALALVVVGALAYYLTRPNPDTIVATTGPTVVERNTKTTVLVPVTPAPGAPAPTAEPRIINNTETHTEKSSTVTIQTSPTAAPRSGGSSAPPVIINNNNGGAAPAAAPTSAASSPTMAAAPTGAPATTGAAGGTGNSTTGTGSPASSPGY